MRAEWQDTSPLDTKLRSKSFPGYIININGMNYQQIRDTIKVFYDCLGGDRFGIIWEPSVTDPKPFRAMNRFSSTPVRKVTFLVRCLISELTRL